MYETPCQDVFESSAPCSYYRGSDFIFLYIEIEERFEIGFGISFDGSQLVDI